MSAPRIRWVVAATLLGCAAGRPAVTAPAAARATEEARVEGALRGFFAAAEHKDWRALDAMLAPEFEFFSDGLLVLDKTRFLSEMRSDDMDIGKLELSQVRVVLSQDARIAWVKYRALLESSRKGQPYNMQSAETVCFRKDGDEWRMTHNHASIKELK
jgi:ketosteroid isomerase-like protein